MIEEKNSSKSSILNPIEYSNDRRAIVRQHAEKKISIYLKSLSTLHTLSIIVFSIIIVTLAFFLYFAIENEVFIDMFMYKNATEYGIIIDAGSHGSRLHLYCWPERIHDREHPLTGPITYPKEVAVFTTSPGISSIAENVNNNKQELLENTGEIYIKPLLTDVQNYLKTLGIDKQEWLSIPLFLQATAGMRSLDSSVRSGVMNSIRRYLSNTTTSPFTFHWNWARVIAGEEEGVYGWISVNNELGTLLSPAYQTTGALDMGGASMQITFSPLHTSVLEDYYGLNFAGQTQRLYSHSYLGYGWGDSLMRITTKLAVEHIIDKLYEGGLNSAPKRHLVDAKKKEETFRRLINQKNQTLLQSKEKQTDIIYIDAIHPCYPTGYKTEFQMPALTYPQGRFYIDVPQNVLLLYIHTLGVKDEESLHHYLNEVYQGRSGDSYHRDDTLVLPYGKPNSNSLLTEEPYYSEDDSADYNLSQPITSMVFLDDVQVSWIIRFKGSSDFKTCLKKAKELFYDQPCFIHSCSFNGLYQPRLENSRFVALGQYAKLYHALNMTSNNSTLKEIKMKSEEICAKSRKTLREEKRKNRLMYSPYGKNGIMKLCWKSVWTLATLNYGYGFPLISNNIEYATTNITHNDINYNVLNTTAIYNLTSSNASIITNTQFSWASGSMLYAVNTFPWKLPQAHYELPFIWALLCLILLILLTGIHLTQLRYHSRILECERYLKKKCSARNDLATALIDQQEAYVEILE